MVAGGGALLGLGGTSGGAGSLLPGSRLGGVEEDQRLFSAALARAEAGETGEGEAREAAEQLVAASLVGPVLKSLRESTGAAGPFAPGSGERMFRELQDAVLAQRLVKSAQWPLVDTLAQRMLRRGGGSGAP